MSDDLYRLVYYSHNAVTGDADTVATAITSILAKSQVNNQRVGVTGALMFNSGCFAQVLEGPRSAVEEVFERIQQDDRHGDVSLLAFDPVPTRAFEDWSMGFVGASIGDAARYGVLVDSSGFDPARMDGDALFETLRGLAMEEEHVEH
ncbi:BLUF domain-containing protein [Glacieibacterium megasporae]|uniref:BLUF domain-containing protein n=1 Tax=Glacieibacterium megasporae TaxID=2835787 RepID=UPI001C1E5340|nr:BLUF domain-containing protein [Polymorphobacter megasporae]UAJ10613.1 BLUF domain-containing protein [Polymorphobacter megasporae]